MLGPVRLRMNGASLLQTGGWGLVLVELILNFYNWVRKDPCFIVFAVSLLSLLPGLNNKMLHETSLKILFLFIRFKYFWMWIYLLNVISWLWIKADLVFDMVFVMLDSKHLQRKSILRRIGKQCLIRKNLNNAASSFLKYIFQICLMRSEL